MSRNKATPPEFEVTSAFVLNMYKLTRDRQVAEAEQTGAKAPTGPRSFLLPPFGGITEWRLFEEGSEPREVTEKELSLLLR